MNEYKIKWFSLTYNCAWTAILLWVMFKLVVLVLNMFQQAEGQDKLLWIIILGLMMFAMKFRIPYFDSFVICDKCGQGIHN